MNGTDISSQRHSRYIAGVFLAMSLACFPVWGEEELLEQEDDVEWAQKQTQDYLTTLLTELKRFVHDCIGIKKQLPSDCEVWAANSFLSDLIDRNMIRTASIEVTRALRQEQKEQQDQRNNPFNTESLSNPSAAETPSVTGIKGPEDKTSE
jgi:hypothetical protein